MVQAILEGTKNQTRRIVKNNNSLYASKFSELDFNDAFVEGFNISDKCLKAKHLINDTRQLVLSKIETGDILWVRETFIPPLGYGTINNYLYKTDYSNLRGAKWKPSIFMPKEACRIFLEVTIVRVERLQEISNEDAKAEGIQNHYLLKDSGYTHYTRSDKFIPFGETDAEITSFLSLWISINGAESLDANPWVWVYDFKRVEKPKNF